MRPWCGTTKIQPNFRWRLDVCRDLLPVTFDQAGAATGTSGGFGMTGSSALRRAVGVLAGVAVLVAGGLAGQAQAATGTVSTTPTATTPYLVNTGTTPVTKVIRQCGSMMYAVGTFSSVRQPNHPAVTRNNVFSF